MKITKAVIPAAGLGTRMLPMSKAVPKEMFPIVDKPAIQYIVEEAAAAGITDILIITNRGKEAMEDHFDHAYELERSLLVAGKTKEAEQVAASASLANVYFLRQKSTAGLGHAVLCAKEFIGNDPFAVLYGDDVIIGEDPAIAQLCGAYEKYGKGVAGIKEMPLESVMKYCSLKLSPLRDNVYAISDMIEKPKREQVFSLFSILGRCVLPPDIFSILEHTPPGAGGELQLTDAMKALALRDGMIGVDFTGRRYDIGSKIGMLKANIEVGLAHPEVGGELRSYIKDLANTL